jgi:hypothetical protein
MKFNLPIVIYFLGAPFLWHACSEKPVEPVIGDKDKGISFHMKAYFGDELLSLNGPYYETANGDSIKPTTIIYHINNFFLWKGDDTITVDDSWFMMDFSDVESTEIQLDNLPSGEYDGIGFTIGVADSVTNADGLLNNRFLVPMYWSMNAGYINFKFEGESPQAPNGTNVLHVGGYTSEFKLSRTIRLGIPGGITVPEEGYSDLNVKMDIYEYFTTPNTIDLSQYHLIHEPNEQARNIADNWPGMFSYLP